MIEDAYQAATRYGHHFLWSSQGDLLPFSQGRGVICESLVVVCMFDIVDVII